MSQQALATAAGVSATTIKDFEAERRTPIANNVAAIEQVFTRKRVQFFEVDGKIGLSAPSPSTRTSESNRATGRQL